MVHIIKRLDETLLASVRQRGVQENLVLYEKNNDGKSASWAQT